MPSPMMINLSRRIITLTIPLFLTPIWTAAQEPPPSQITYPYDHSIAATPAMAIIFASIVATFFLMGCLSVYARSCVEYGSADNNVSAVVFGLSRSNNSIVGLDPSVLGSFPTFLYSEVKGLKIGKGALECAVCLSEFEDKDTLRLLPKCCHVFHQDCIDVWLTSNVTCPVCRAVLVPQPGETNNFFLPVHEVGTDDIAEDDIIIEIEPAGTIRIHKESLPPRSTSRKNWFFGKFTRSFTTGHVLVQPDNEYESFTLRLPEEVQNKLVSRSLGQAKSGVVFSRVRSKWNGYRSASVGATKGRSLLNYELLEPEGRLDRWRFMRTPPVASRTGSIQSPSWVCGPDYGVDIFANTSKSLSRSVRPEFERTTCEASDSMKEDVIIGERSFDRLIIDGDRV